MATGEANPYPLRYCRELSSLYVSLRLNLNRFGIRVIMGTVFWALRFVPSKKNGPDLVIVKESLIRYWRGCEFLARGCRGGGHAPDPAKEGKRGCSNVGPPKQVQFPFGLILPVDPTMLLTCPCVVNSKKPLDTHCRLSDFVFYFIYYI